MSLLTHLLTFMAGGTVGVIAMALLAAHGERERRHRMEVANAQD